MCNVNDLKNRRIVDDFDDDIDEFVDDGETAITDTENLDV